MEHQVSNLEYAENIPKAAEDISSELNYIKVLPSGGQSMILQVSDVIYLWLKKKKKKKRKPGRTGCYFISYHSTFLWWLHILYLQQLPIRLITARSDPGWEFSYANPSGDYITHWKQVWNPVWNHGSRKWKLERFPSVRGPSPSSEPQIWVLSAGNKTTGESKNTTASW